MSPARFGKMVQFISMTNLERTMNPGELSVKSRLELKNLKGWLNGITCAIHPPLKAIAILPYKMVKFRTGTVSISKFGGRGPIEMELT